jgi:cytochrome c oxidase subunit 2
MGRRELALVAVLSVAAFVFVTMTAQSQGSPTPAASPSAGTPAAGATPGASPVAGEVDLVAAERGRLAAAVCLACHSVDGSVMVGPSWQGLYGHEVELEDGSTVIADEAYLRESITDPMVKIVKGYPPSMPPFPLTDEQIDDIIEYIKSLQ